MPKPLPELSAVASYPRSSCVVYDSMICAVARPTPSSRPVFRTTGWLSTLLVLVLSACSTPHRPLDNYEEIKPDTAVAASPSDPHKASPADANVEHGQYLVELLGCAICHTDGALIGRTDLHKRLAGSRIGIAYSDPLIEANPGVVYPPNLTPDPETGLGAWSDDEMLKMIRTGIDRHGRLKLAVMPWPSYARLSDRDARDIVAYLRHLTPIQHRVPANVAPGEKATAPFVHFGVYRSKAM